MGYGRCTSDHDESRPLTDDEEAELSRPDPIPTYTVDGDVLLQTFASVCQTTDTRIGLTLSVPGAAVSGLLIGRNQWLDELAAATVAAGAGEFGDAVRQGSRLPEPGDEDEDSEVRYGYLHLRDAVIFADQPRTVGLWRGRINQVAGWTLTQFQPSGG